MTKHSRPTNKPNSQYADSGPPAADTPRAPDVVVPFRRHARGAGVKPEHKPLNELTGGGRDVTDWASLPDWEPGPGMLVSTARTVTDDQAKAFADELCKLLQRHNLVLLPADAFGALMIYNALKGAKTSVAVARLARSLPNANPVIRLGVAAVQYPGPDGHKGGGK